MRARRIRFTPVGLEWLQAFRQAVRQAEAEFSDQVGAPVATVIAIGLEAYANGYQDYRPPSRTRGKAAGRGLK